MQDRVIREAVIIQNSIEDQSMRNLEIVTNLRGYVESLQRTISTFVENLEDAVEDNLQEEPSPQYPEIHKLYLFLNRLVKQVAGISKRAEKVLTQHVLSPLKTYSSTLQEQNSLLYQQLCTHYKQTAIAFKTMDFNPDISDLYNPILKQRDILDKCREKYRVTLQRFQSLNENHLQFTKTHLITTIRAINQLLNLDGVERYISGLQFIKPLKPQPVVTELISEIQQELGASTLLSQSQAIVTFSEGEVQMLNFINYLVSSNTQELKNYEETRSMILGNQGHSVFFIQQFADHLKLDMSFPVDKYYDVQSMIKFIFATLMETEESKQQILLNILRVSSKVRAPNKWLLKELKGYQMFWEDIQLWKSLYSYTKQLKESKSNQRHYQRKLKTLSTLKRQKIDKLNFATSSRNQEIALQIIREISVYLAGLEIQNEFVLHTLIHLCKGENIPRVEIQKLIKYQHGSRKELLNQIYENPLVIKKEREGFMVACEDHKLVTVVGMSLRFLSIEERILQLRLVSKEWNMLLTKDIYRRYLEIEDNSNRTRLFRLPVYLASTNTHQLTEEKYRLELAKIPVDFSYRQIILLDVKRSLQWNPSLQPILSQILCLFAYNYPDTGYLQGMNYLVQNLLKLTHKPHEAYQIFQYTMRTYYLSYYSNNFAILRLRIYQLIRLMEMHIPELARHFERQKVEGEYYLLPWAITLWGEYPGELSMIMTDGFILDGWIWWIKVSLWLLNENKQELLERRFQGIMKLFSDLMKNKVLKQNPLERNGRNIKEQINSYEITYELLSKIQKEYMCSNDQIAEMLEEKQPSTSAEKSRRSSKNHL